MSYSAMEIAQYIITYCNKNEITISNLKLQKLLYFAWIQFYNRTGRKLFDDKIRARQLGPVVFKVYNEYCAFGGKDINREYDVRLDENDEKVLHEFLNEYGEYSTRQLVDESCRSGGAWEHFYRNGEGNFSTITFDIVVLLECERIKTQ